MGTPTRDNKSTSYHGAISRPRWSKTHLHFSPRPFPRDWEFADHGAKLNQFPEIPAKLKLFPAFVSVSGVILAKWKGCVGRRSGLIVSTLQECLLPIGMLTRVEPWIQLIRCLRGQSVKHATASQRAKLPQRVARLSHIKSSILFHLLNFHGSSKDPTAVCNFTLLEGIAGPRKGPCIRYG